MEFESKEFRIWLNTNDGCYDSEVLHTIEELINVNDPRKHRAAFYTLNKVGLNYVWEGQQIPKKLLEILGKIGDLPYGNSGLNIRQIVETEMNKTPGNIDAKFFRIKD